MKALLKYIAASLSLIFMGSSCRKETTRTNEWPTENVVVLPVPVSGEIISATAGETCVLLLYGTSRNYELTMTNNQGGVLWSKALDLTDFEDFAISLGPIIFAQPNNEFHLFYGSSRLRMNAKGETLALDTLFLDDVRPAPVGGLTYRIGVNKMIATANDTYLVMGDYNLSGNRAFIAEIDQSGEMLFQKFYTANVNGSNQYTGGIALEDGGYLVAGTTTAGKSSFFIQKLNASGKILRTTLNEVDNYNFTGHEFFKKANGDYVYLVCPFTSNNIDRRARFYTVNDTGAILDTSYLDLAGLNISQGMVEESDGSFIGLVKDKDESNNNAGSFTQPEYAYLYKLDTEGKVLNQRYLYRSYSSSYKAITKLSDGKTLIAGSTLSFGEEYKLSLLFQ
tara:strand:- start:20090 stop:21271 length:1182 start_codon:yes stop_codon:yes gene_type:complete